MMRCIHNCQKKLYSDGYKIYTSIDLTMQQQLQDSIDLTLLDFTDTTDDGTFKLQSAATCIDNDTGEVVAIVGGQKPGCGQSYAKPCFPKPSSAGKLNQAAHCVYTII